MIKSILLCLISVAILFAQDGVTLRRRPPFYGAAGGGAACLETAGFSGANGTHLDDWNSDWNDAPDNADNTADIFNNNVTMDNGTPADTYAFNDGCAFSADQYSEFTYNQVNGGGVRFLGVSVRCRASTQDDCYAITIGNGAGGEDFFGKIINGSFTTFYAYNRPWSINDKVTIEANGTTIRYLANDGEVQSQTDSSISSGYPGIHVYEDGDNPRADDWEGGDL